MTTSTAATTKARQARADRARGTAFEIIYAPRAEPRAHKIAQKTGPMPRPQQTTPQRTAREKTIAALRDNAGHVFCVAIATPADGDKTMRIKGRAL